MTAVAMALVAGMCAGLFNAVVTVGFKLPAFIATLGMFYIARGLAAWFTAGQQLTGWNERYNLMGRKIDDILAHYGIRLDGPLHAVAQAVSVQTLWMLLVALLAGVVLAYTPFGQRIYATGGNRRAADYAGIDTARVRALLQLNVQGFAMPQHWFIVFIGTILIVAVLIDIWLRQANIFGRLRAQPPAKRGQP